jgi:hypothetical protein
VSLPKTPSALQSLKLADRLLISGDHELCCPLINSYAVVVFPNAGKEANRDPRTSSSACCFAAAEDACKPQNSRPFALGDHFPFLEAVALSVVIVKPETVIAWHRRGFRLYWRWKSRAGKCGRPGVSIETRELIRQMSKADPLWGAPRIHGELLKLGIEISQATVAKYMWRQGKSPSQSWRTFLENQVQQIVATDFLVVRTVSFRLLFVFVVVGHHRRHAIHFNVTAHPTAEWTARQIAEAFPWDSVPRYLLHDRDCIYGAAFQASC